MKRKMIGLNTYLYTFEVNDRDNYTKVIQRLQSKGMITEVFVNNKLAFEFKEYKLI